MSAHSLPGQTLAGALWPETRASRGARFVVLALVGSALMTLSAKTQIPFFPVPMTLQTFALMAISAAFGSRLAAATMLVYVAEGALGLPVFSGTPEKGIGLAYMLGGTGGYLVGFVFAAFLVGFVAERGGSRSVIRLGAAMLAGDVIVFGFGLAWLGLLFGWDQPILEWGLYPFIHGDLIKIALAACGVPAAMALIRRIKG